MNIGGFLPVSLSDYPGHVAAVVFTQGCNFRCPFCHNGNLIPLARPACDLLCEEEILKSVAARRGKLDAVVVSGGEPTLQADLAEFLHKLKKLGYAVKLDTNGSRPVVLESLLKSKLIDYVAMDIKAPLPCYERLAGVTVDVSAIRQSIEVLPRSGIDHQFRTTEVRLLLEADDMNEIRALVPSESTHRVQPFRREHALAGWLRQRGAEQPTHRARIQPRIEQALATGEIDEHQA